MEKRNSMLECSRCGEDNTEFSRFLVTQKIEDTCVEPSGWITWLVGRLLGKLTVIVQVDVCQRCQSRMFRGLDKNK